MRDILVSGKAYTSSYKKIVLTILTGMYILNFADRFLINTLTVPIQKEMHLSDTQVGLLTGFSFVFFYAILAIPIARFADRSNRRNVVAFSMILWSLFTVLSGTSASFVFLLLMRIGVGIGEAGGTTPASAMISDYYSPEKRAAALSIFASGLYIGGAIGAFAGGWLNQLYGWRMAFLVVGSPGIVYAIILILSVKEPTKGNADREIAVIQQVGFMEGCRFLIKKRTFLFLSIACSLSAFVSFSMLTWQPAFFSRIYGMKSSEYGSLLALKSVSGAIACFAGGFLIDRLAKRDNRWYLWISGYATVASIPFFLVLLFGHHSLLLLAVMSFMGSLFFQTFIGAAFFVTHSLVPAQMRSFATAILLFILNMIGLGLGPLVIGRISDQLKGQFGNESIRWALSCTMIILMIASVFYFKAAQHLKNDLIYTDTDRKSSRPHSNPDSHLMPSK